jgi:branched-chain amino acid transport system ATP-binding protein
MSVEKETITLLVGSNGAGKSTLMRCVSGILPPTNGSILLDDERINHFQPHQIVERGLIQVPEGRKIFPSLTVQENLEMGSMHRAAKRRRAETMKEVLDLFPRLLERRKQLAGTLSGGEQQILAIGRALMGMPRVLLLDEPSMGLAPIIVQLVFEALKRIHEAGGTIFLVEQNLRASMALADYAYVIENGIIVLEGTSSELMADEKAVKAYLGVRKQH